MESSSPSLRVFVSCDAPETMQFITDEDRFPDEFGAACALLRITQVVRARICAELERQRGLRHPEEGLIVGPEEIDGQRVAVYVARPNWFLDKSLRDFAAEAALLEQRRGGKR